MQNKAYAHSDSQINYGRRVIMTNFITKDYEHFIRKLRKCDRCERRTGNASRDSLASSLLYVNVGIMNGNPCHYERPLDAATSRAGRTGRKRVSPRRTQPKVQY